MGDGQRQGEMEGSERFLAHHLSPSAREAADNGGIIYFGEKQMEVIQKRGLLQKKFIKTSPERQVYSESFPGRAWGWHAGAMLPPGYSLAWGHEAPAPPGFCYSFSRPQECSS